MHLCGMIPSLFSLLLVSSLQLITAGSVPGEFTTIIKSHQASLLRRPVGQFYLSRRLAAVTVSSLNRTSQCVARPGRCWASPLALLTSEAPAPESAGGKMFAKLASISYLCGLHTSTSACRADVKNACDMYIATSGTTVSNGAESPSGSSEQWCDISDDAMTALMFDYSVCPGSLFDKYLKCNSTSTGAAECAANAAGCKWLENCNLFEPCCLPTDLVALNETAQLQLLSDIKAAKKEVWGCCSGQRLWSKVISCMSRNTSADCIGDCYWDPYEASCLVDRGAWFDALLVDSDTAFSQYVRDVDSKCKSLTDPFTCNHQPQLVNVNAAKAAQFSVVPINKPSACVPSTVDATPTVNATTASNKSAAAAVLASVEMMLALALGVLALLGMLC